MKMMFQFRKQKRWKQKQLLSPACPGQEASSGVELQTGIMVSSHQAQGCKLRAGLMRTQAYSDAGQGLPMWGPCSLEQS